VTQTLTIAGVISILKQVASDEKAHIEELRQLDAVLGDGDMGVTIELGSRAIDKYLNSTDEKDIGKLLVKCGTNFNKASPSTFGTLLASAFMEAGKACLGKKEISIEDLVAVGKSAVEGVKKRGKAEIGDKTMLDSLIPAVEAFQLELAKGAHPEVALDAAVKAAESGMKATINMKAKHSRASWHQEDSIGVQDAGATAMYHIIESFVRHLIFYIVHRGCTETPHKTRNG